MLLAATAGQAAAAPARLVRRPAVRPGLPASVAALEAVGSALASEGLASSGDVRPVRVTPGASGLTRVRLDQLVEGVPVFRGAHDVALAADGGVLAVMLGEVADPGRPGPWLVDAGDATAVADRTGQIKYWREEI